MELKKFNVIEEKGVRWLGHVKRMQGTKLPRIIVAWGPEGTRRKGRRRKDGWLAGWMDGWMEGWMDGWMNVQYIYDSSKLIQRNRTFLGFKYFVF